MTTKKTTRVEKPKPTTVTMERPKADPRLCDCANVVRRYDGDGLIEQIDGVNHYRCSACGKLYS